MMLLELFNPVFDKEVFHIELPLLQYFLQKQVRDVHLALSLVGHGIAFQDGGFKSFCVIVLLIEVRDEFLPFKRESMADYKVAVYAVEFAVLGNHNLYFSAIYA